MRKVLVVVLAMVVLGLALIGNGCSSKKVDPVRETVVYPDGHVEYLDEINVIPIEVKEIEIVPINVTTWENNVTTWEDILVEEVLTEEVLTEEILVENYN